MDDQHLCDAIETRRLRLRSPRASDAPALSALMNPAISRWLAAWPAPCTPEMALERIIAARQAMAEGRGFACTIERRTIPGAIGWASVLCKPGEASRAKLGYWLGQDHHGRGYMREAGPAILEAAFRRLDVDLIEAAAQPENTASIAVLRACGMKPMGERAMWAPARGREEVCRIFEIGRRPA